MDVNNKGPPNNPNYVQQICIVSENTLFSYKYKHTMTPAEADITDCLRKTNFQKKKTFIWCSRK